MRANVLTVVRILMGAVSLLCLRWPAAAQPTADQILSVVGLQRADA